MADELTAGEVVSEPTVVAINETLTSERLDRYLTTQLPHISRGGIQRLLREGNILVDGKPAKPTQHPVAGQTVEITWPVPKEVEAWPEELPTLILHGTLYTVVPVTQSDRLASHLKRLKITHVCGRLEGWS